MSLTLHRSARVDVLADALAARLQSPLGDPFAAELIVVPAKGVERWLSQRLSHHLGATDSADGPIQDGVAANIDFRSPRSLVAQVAGADEHDPWRPDALVWPLLEVIDASLGEPWCAALTRHLGKSGLHGDDRRHGRRWAVAHRIALRFASYAAQRPGMLRAWEAGTDSDGLDQPIDADLAWQPELWRRVVERLGVSTPGVRLESALENLRRSGNHLDLPPRLSLFGPTRLSRVETDVIEALAAQRDVDVWLPHPSDALWQTLRDKTASGPVVRLHDDSHVEVGHPLLATLGRDLRELQRTVATLTETSVTADLPVDRPDSLLGRLQDDIEANREPTTVGATPDDRSVQVHACHGAARQVEVLREVIVGLLADDPTLEPRDIVVMCPDIEQFAPLIEATFGLGGLTAAADWHPGQQLQVRLADRSLVQTNPLLAVVDRLLDMADGRAEASAVLDLAATEPVRRRFGFSDDDLDTIGRWIDQTGIRWAFDASHREPFGLSEYVQNTWRFGLDRLLAGVAVSADAQRYFGATLPYDDVGSGDIDLVGRLSEFISRLGDLSDRLTGTHAVGHWVDTLRGGLSSLTAVGWGDEWQQHQAERELATMVADQVADQLTLRLADVRALVSDRLVGRPTRANFRTGSLTVCTMVPMRSVPHRVVCLVGIDDGIFPRATSLDGDDVLARRPVTGERDVRSEDRQLMLDAVMAATQTLVITYSGANEVTGRSRPPAVPLGELLDTLELMVSDARGSVVVHHPLQPFDRRNFIAGELGGAQPFSFDQAARQAAVAAGAERTDIAGLLDVTVATQPTDVDLTDLGAFLRAPVKEFLRRSVGLNVFDDDDEVRDAIPVELGSLEKWAVGKRLLDDQLQGLTPRQALDNEWRRGELPPGRMGWSIAQRMSESVEPIVSKALSVMGDSQRTSADVDIDLGQGRRLRGTVPGVHGNRVIEVSYSSLGPRHYLDAWVPLLALSVAQPDVGWTAGTIARDRDGAQMVVFNPIEADEARRYLDELVALYDLGMTQPLRLPLKTGFRLAKAGEDGRWGARSEWTGKFGENRDPLLSAVWGADAPFEVLRDATPDLVIDALAERLWRPVIEKAVLA